MNLPELPPLFDEVVQLVGDRVELQVVIESKAGSIELPGNQQEFYETPVALVVSVGPDVKVCKRGDVVTAQGKTVMWRFQRGDRKTFIVEEGRLIGVLIGRNVLEGIKNGTATLTTILTDMEHRAG